MRDTLRLVSSEDVGRDEASVQSLLKKHKVCQMKLIWGHIFEKFNTIYILETENIKEVKF